MSQQPFGDIPLFRELQRLLATSGSGPINLDIAGQVATAIATQGKHEAAAGNAARRTVADAVHASEAVLAGYTRLNAVEPIRTRVTSRAGWARDTLTSWLWLLERLAARFMDVLSGQDDQEGGGQLQMAMKQIGPLLMGLQTGTLVGNLALEATSTYDLPIPREGENELVFVIGNIEQIATDYEIDVERTLRWITVQDAARDLVVQAVPWVSRYRKTLITDLVDTIEIDMSQLERRLMDIQTQGVEALQEGSGISDALPLVHSDLHRAALDRVRAFVGLHEGYASHATGAVGERLLGDVSKVEEAVTRQRTTASEAKDLLANVLGFALDRDLATMGKTFCAAVVELHGLPALNRVWEAPDNLPNQAELKDPFVWIERVLTAG